jgi:SHS2 domain-containing protein
MADGAESRTGHRALPHTADVILEAWAPTLEGCIAEAVAALVGSFVDTVHTHECAAHPFRIPVTTTEAALVTVLEEALYVLDMAGQVPLSTTIADVGAGTVQGSFALADVSDRDLRGSVPKGISLSGLRLGREGELWRCRFTVDV